MHELFPIINENISLELINISNYNISFNADRFELNLKYTHYSKHNNIIYISDSIDIDLPLMELPRLSKHDTIAIESIQRILVSQSIRIPDISIKRVNKLVNINLLTLKSNYLHIKGSSLGIEIGIGNSFSDYASFMLSMGVKTAHVFKNFMNIVRIAYYKNK